MTAIWVGVLIFIAVLYALIAYAIFPAISEALAPEGRMLARIFTGCAVLLCVACLAGAALILINR